MAKTVFEQMGGTYIRQGDYELPVAALLPQEKLGTAEIIVDDILTV